MTVVSAAVESDGWTLAVTYNATGPATRSDFVLFDGGPGLENQTEANARVVATVSGPGFNRVGSEAVSATRDRQIVAHEVRYGRYPDWEAGQPTSLQPQGFSTTPPLAPSNRPLGEVDNGNGTRTIRLMLHKPVAPGETVSVTFNAGWRPNATTDQTITATNNSTVPLEIPSFRWLTVPYEALRGTPTEPVNSTVIDMVAAHVLPEGKSGVAGIRIIATDGTNRSVASWLSIGTSTRYGDSVRCWTGNVSFEVDGAPGTYLNSGLIALHATVYPWFGEPRHSSGANDPATAAPSVLHPGNNSGFESVQCEAERALMLAYDRTGSRYGYTTQATVGGGTNPRGYAASTYYRYACVVVDPAGGRTTSADAPSRNVAEQIVGLGNTPEEARAKALEVSTADRCANIATAGSMLTRLGRGLDNANGYSATKTNAHDGFEIYLIEATHEWTNTAALSGATGTETHVLLTGAGTTATIVNGPSSGSAQYGGQFRVRMRQFTARMRSSAAFAVGGTAGVAWFDQGMRIEDFDTGSPLSQFGSGPPSANTMRIFATNMVENFVTARWSNASGAALMVRSISSRQGFASPTVVNCVKTGAATTVSALAAPPYPSGTNEAGRQDVHLWNNDCRHTHALSGWAFVPVIYTASDGRVKLIRQNVINNIMEKSGGSSAAAYAIGELNNPPLDVRGLIIEHNTIVGDRANHCYNDPAPVDIEGSFTRTNTLSQCRIANNYFDRMACKHDAFFDGNTSTIRSSLGEPATTRGYRGHLIQGWQTYFGHLNEGNVDGWLFVAGTTAGADPENRGIRCAVTPFPATSAQTADTRAWPAFTAPASRYYGGAGNGDYTPQATSPLRDRCTSAQIDVDRRGRLRSGVTWSAGALDAEPETPPPALLDPATARHGHLASRSSLATVVALVVASARHAFRAMVAMLEFVPDPGSVGSSARIRRVPREDRRVQPDRD